MNEFSEIGQANEDFFVALAEYLTSSAPGEKSTWQARLKKATQNPNLNFAIRQLYRQFAGISPIVAQYRDLRCFVDILKSGDKDLWAKTLAAALGTPSYHFVKRVSPFAGALLIWHKGSRGPGMPPTIAVDTATCEEELALSFEKNEVYAEDTAVMAVPVSQHFQVVSIDKVRSG